MPGSPTTPDLRVLALTLPAVLPSVFAKTSASGIKSSRGSMAGLYIPLPTLHPRPYERRRTAWGRCGLLLLHRIGLAPTTPCRSPGALRNMLEGIEEAADASGLALQVLSAKVPTISIAHLKR